MKKEYLEHETLAILSFAVFCGNKLDDGVKLTSCRTGMFLITALVKFN